MQLGEPSEPVAETFVPQLVRKKPGHYRVEPPFVPRRHLSILNRRKSSADGTEGWVKGVLGNVSHEQIIHCLLSLMKQQRYWMGVGIECFRLHLESIQPLSVRAYWRRVSDHLDELLSEMKQAGWIALIFDEQGQPVIYLTEKLIAQIQE